MANKLGPYINRLMTTVLDKEQEEFVVDLAWSELKRINADVEEFLRTNSRDDSKETEKSIKKLLQEEKQAQEATK